MDWEVQGIERLKRHGILVVSNHPTLLDVVFLIAFMPNADCIIKSGILKNPLMSGIVSLAGYIKNDGGPLLIEGAKKSLNYGNSLIIFAEGTRTKQDEKISFLRGAANIIIRTKTAPTPVVINCFPKTLSKGKKWYSIPSKKFSLTIRVLEEMELNRFLVLPSSVGARKITNYMEEFFRQEVALNEH
jgi:1-acyl-sn-glycerol-3-phosphate acyltransferase